MVQTRNGAKRHKSTVLDATLGNNDVLLGIAPYLDCDALFNLALVSQRFGSKLANNISLVQDVARQIIGKSMSDEERAQLPRYDGESWIALLHELECLRGPLEFNQRIGYPLDYVNGDRACVTSSNEFDVVQTFRNNSGLESVGYPVIAMCSNNIMRAGKHYASFTLTGDFNIFYCFPGIVRPIKDLDNLLEEEGGFRQTFCFWDRTYLPDMNAIFDRTDRWGSHGSRTVDFCMYSAPSGCCVWGNFQSDRARMDQGRLDWVGDDDTEVGMLLDLDEGTLEVYVNGERLGVLKDGLSGEYCWTATVQAQEIREPEQQNVRIQRGPVPMS